MKTAIVHDWLMSAGGAERVLGAIIELYPSPIYTLVKNNSIFENQIVKTSFLQKMPLVQKFYRNYLPLFPFAIERFDLSEYDLILSSSHAVAKGVRTHEKQLHICYCHSPMRYAWDLHEQYMGQLGNIKRNIAKWVLHYVRNWDIQSLNRVDHFIANSQFIAQRIKRIYNKEAVVIYPPVSTHLFESKKKDNFYLTVSRMVPYKRVDLIVEAFTKHPDKYLCVIGDGPDLEKLQQKATKNIQFLGYQEDIVVRDYLTRAKAFIFAAEEDFGIVPVEAQAAGTPVIAYGKGGVLETVLEGKTGLFFHEQTVESLQDAIKRFEQLAFDSDLIQRHAAQFNESRFKKELKQFVDLKWEEFYENRNSCRR